MIHPYVQFIRVVDTDFVVRSILIRYASNYILTRCVRIIQSSMSSNYYLTFEWTTLATKLFNSIPFDFDQISYDLIAHVTVYMAFD